MLKNIENCQNKLSFNYWRHRTDKIRTTVSASLSLSLARIFKKSADVTISKITKKFYILTFWKKFHNLNLCCIAHRKNKCCVSPFGHFFVNLQFARYANSALQKITAICGSTKLDFFFHSREDSIRFLFIYVRLQMARIFFQKASHTFMYTAHQHFKDG